MYLRRRLRDRVRVVRTERSRPLIESLHEWFEISLPKLSRKSDTTAAIRYALGLWPALTHYCDDGRLEIDNNAAERALRVVALGRKNYLFAGSDLGGERAASIYSLVGSAKLNGLDPEARRTRGSYGFCMRDSRFVRRWVGLSGLVKDVGESVGRSEEAIGCG